MTTLLTHLLAALALFPASCGVTTKTPNRQPQLITHRTDGWQVTACVFTKPGFAQVGSVGHRRELSYASPPPQPCTLTRRRS